MEDSYIENQYNLIKEYYNKFLKDKNVKLPKLKSKKGYTKGALILVFLSQNYPNTRKYTKTELTKFIKEYYPEVNDVQQARHLGAQSGWYIISGTRNDTCSDELKHGEYQLVTLETNYPGFTGEKRLDCINNDYWETLKASYNYRCATCGSKEGEPNLHWPNTITKLQKGHMNPNKPLIEGNVIPQCEKCNRPDENYWIYDKKGRVVKIANPIIIDKCSLEIQKEIYSRLYKKFNGKNPTDI